MINIDLLKLIKKVLKGIEISKKTYYSAKLREHRETLKKSRGLIQRQRVLKTMLEKQGFDFVMSGNVRAQKVFVDKKPKIIFREKGVDVRIAVDLVVAAWDKEIKTAVICSSDSDLQPAVGVLKNRGVEVIYLGFEINPNKGLMYTSDRAILIRNSEVIDSLKTKEKPPKK